MGFRDENVALRHQVRLLTDRVDELEARRPELPPTAPREVSERSAHELEVDAELDADGVGYLAEELRRSTNTLGETSMVGRALAWKGGGFEVTITPHAGRTRVHVRQPRWPVLRVLALLLPLSALWAAGVNGPEPMALGAFVASALALVVLASRALGARRRKKLMARLRERALTASVVTPLRVRVPSVEHSEVLELEPSAKGASRAGAYGSVPRSGD